MIGIKEAKREIKLVTFIADNCAINLAEFSKIWDAYAQWKKEEIDRPFIVVFSPN